MWTSKGCILTFSDFNILEQLQKNITDGRTAFARLLEYKLENAQLMTREDIPPTIATLNSRVRYRIGDATPQVRLLTPDPAQGMVGLSLPLTTMRGMGLLGLAEGEAIALLRDGETAPERLVLEAVIYQPEAALREMAERANARPALRLVHDAAAPVPSQAPDLTGDDDPGPSAA